MPDVTTTPTFSVAGEDAIILAEHHRMLGGSRLTGRLLCSCGKVVLSWESDTWGVHLADVWAGWTPDDEDGPIDAAPDRERGGMSEASRQAWRAEKRIPETPREQLPSRQDRRVEYERRNAKRRRERAEAQREASSAPVVGSSHQSGTP
jgi:hypothetical protein